jgi:AraC family transcriptional regulator, dual regulator of chb operon
LSGRGAHGVLLYRDPELWFPDPVRRLRWSAIAFPGQVVHVARRGLRGSNPVRVHTHDFAEVLWVERGTGVHWANGEKTRLGPGDLVLVRPHDRHGFFDGDPAFTIVNVAFPAATLVHLRRRYAAADPGFFGGRARRPATVAVGPGERRLLAAAAAELQRHPRDRLRGERFLLNLLHDLGGRGPRRALQSCPPWLQEACARLREPANLEGGVRALARIAGRSPEHVARQLRACAGLRPVDLVTEARMDHAASQLALTERPVVEVALECGFDSLSHFYRVFRRRLGETPGAYRLRCQSALR